jgi:hypothetical protein
MLGARAAINTRFVYVSPTDLITSAERAENVPSLFHLLASSRTKQGNGKVFRVLSRLDMEKHNRQRRIASYPRAERQSARNRFPCAETLID